MRNVIAKEKLSDFLSIGNMLISGFLVSVSHMFINLFSDPLASLQLMAPAIFGILMYFLLTTLLPALLEYRNSS